MKKTAAGNKRQNGSRAEADAASLKKNPTKSAAGDAAKKANAFRFWVSPLFFLLAAVLIYLGYGLELAGYLVTVVCHEFAHAAVAKRLGYTLNGIKLMPYGAALSGDFASVRPRDEILIALAGPAVNIALAVVTVAAWWLAPVTYVFTEAFLYGNLFTAVFNLVPLYPLDGGRVLLAGLSVRFKRQSAYKALRIAGFAAAVVFAALFFVTFYYAANLSLALISSFFFLSTVVPDKQSAYRRLYSMGYRSEKVKKGLPVKEVLISSDTELFSLVRMLNANYFYRFTVVDSGFKTVGTVTELELESLCTRFSGNIAVGKAVGQRKTGD